MNISSITAFNIYNTSCSYAIQNNAERFCTKPMPFDSICFTGVQSGSVPLKKLAAYGIPDMYNGLKLLDPKILEGLLQRSVFDKPISQLVPIISKYKDTFLPVERQVLEYITIAAEKQSNLKLNDVLKNLNQEHQKKLLKIQQPIFEQLIQKACDLPPELYKEFWDLMKITNKRLSKEPVVIPFSENDFIYKLQRIAPIIKARNIHKETLAINNLIKEAKLVFAVQEEDAIKFGRGKNGRNKKLEYQMRPAVLKQNIVKLKYLEDIFAKSVLRNNKDIQQIFQQTSARIHGFPAITPFKRKEFVHELKNITKRVKDETLAKEIIKTARILPKSTDNVSAFIVKYTNDTNNKIGYFIMHSGICSIDHLDAKANGGKNKLKNFGLCGTYINSQKTNIPFDEWVRKHPETRVNCQKHVDRLIELYNDGTFDKVGLDRSYITDFAEQIEKLSPKEKPLILDISKLNK